MSKMGKLLLMFGIIAIISAVAFGISVAAFGVSNGNYSISIFGSRIPFISIGISPEVTFNDNGTVYRLEYESGNVYEKTFDAAALKDIRLETASANTTIGCSDDDKVYVKYTTGNSKLRFSAEMINGRFTVEESGVFGIFSLGFGSDNNARLEIKLPKKLYNDVEIAVASGKMASDYLTSEKMNIELASGDLDLNVFAKKLSYSAASGHGVLTNCTENTAEHLVVRTASGGQELNGFGSSETDIDIASGYIRMMGISGKVEADIASGKVELDYSVWNDSLEIDLMSGKADVRLPAGSGIDLDFDRASGGMDISLDNDSLSLNKDAGGTYGGTNIRKVSIDVASGHVNIHN